MRFFLTIEYDGSEYIGWQRQNSGLSVQEIVENSIYKIIQINLNIYGSGRTDAGVHATGQVAHVDIITKEFEENKKSLAYSLEFISSNKISLIISRLSGKRLVILPSK